MFLKAWIPVTVAQLYNPVTSLLLPVGEKDVWRGMKTVGELKRERGIQNTVNPDHLYRVFWIWMILFGCLSYFVNLLVHYSVVCGNLFLSFHFPCCWLILLQDGSLELFIVHEEGIQSAEVHFHHTET